ncbi:MAG: hypothetical protein JF604_15155 [Bradyrhizobium sp.]|nr:hypothetical protein [Bradyrhizobium sp.]
MSRVLGMLVIALAAMGAFVAGPTAAWAQTKPAVTSLGPDFPKAGIFIGNSFFYYNNGLPGHLSLMEKAADPEHKQDYRNTMVTIGGSGFDWHDVENYLRPNAIGRYSFDENNNVVFNKSGQLYDVAVMMDCSQCPIHPTLKSVFTDYARKNSDTVRAKGAKPVFFMSWAYADKPEMTAQLAEAYTIAGNENDALVIPAGLAFARAISSGRPCRNIIRNNLWPLVFPGLGYVGKSDEAACVNCRPGSDGGLAARRACAAIGRARGWISQQQIAQ